jgi:hypothetical protein
MEALDYAYDASFFILRMRSYTIFRSKGERDDKKRQGQNRPASLGMLSLRAVRRRARFYLKVIIIPWVWWIPGVS